MLSKITQENVHLLIPFKAAKITRRIMRDWGFGTKEALLAFYHSTVYRQLASEKTKLWHDSGEQIYEKFSQLLVKAPSKSGPKHSRLEPYIAQILVWRHQGMTVRAISEELARSGCVTTAQNIWFFLKRHCGQQPCKNRKSRL